MIAYVFFATADWAGGRPMSLRRRLRILHRHPRKVYFWWLSWLTRTCTRSRLAHCAIGYDGAVLDPGIIGGKMWPFLPFVSSYPTLAATVAVPLENPIDLDKHFIAGRIRVWPTILKWMTFGAIIRTDDCLCVVRRCLIDGGIQVPRRIVSPHQLLNWLIEQGCSVAYTGEFQRPDPVGKAGLPGS